jgi:glycosyltransferase involved in cell wall biosynthesis
MWRLRYWDHWIGLRAKADLVIMANDGTQGDKVLERLGVPKSLVRFWMNGVNIGRTTYSDDEKSKLRAVLGIPKETHVLLAVSRLVTWKRLERIINAMPQILSVRGNTRLVIVGDGEARADYEKIVRDLSLTEAVVFVGAVEQSEVTRYMAIADIFVSLYDLSNVGNPLLEAMSAGKCIVTLNNGDTGLFIANNVSGVLLEYSQLNELPHIIAGVMADERQRSKLGCAAKIFAEREFLSWPERMNLEIAEVEKLG